MTGPELELGSEPLDIVRNGPSRRWVTPVLTVAVGVAMLASVAFAASILGGFADTDDTLERVEAASCERENVLRGEVNRQAEAFVHHNDATLAWALKVRPVLRAADSPAGRRAYRATGDLIQAYRAVRRQYFVLAVVDCERPGPARTPSEPVRPDPQTMSPGP